TRSSARARSRSCCRAVGSALRPIEHAVISVVALGEKLILRNEALAPIRVLHSRINLAISVMLFARRRAPEIVALASPDVRTAFGVRRALRLIDLLIEHAVISVVAFARAVVACPLAGVRPLYRFVENLARALGTFIAQNVVPISSHGSSPGV